MNKPPLEALFLCRYTGRKAERGTTLTSAGFNLLCPVHGDDGCLRLYKDSGRGELDSDDPEPEGEEFAENPVVSCKHCGIEGINAHMRGPHHMSECPRRAYAAPATSESGEDKGPFVDTWVEGIGTVRSCLGCAALVPNGPTRCVRCAVEGDPGLRRAPDEGVGEKLDKDLVEFAYREAFWDGLSFGVSDRDGIPLGDYHAKLERDWKHSMTYRRIHRGGDADA